MMTLGILGGGQLALMTAEAAPGLGIEVVVLEKSGRSPASRVCEEMVGDWHDEATRAAFAARCDLITLENEFVDADALEWFAVHGCPVYPRPATVRTIQDKLCQKETLAAAGLPVAPFRAVESAGDLRRTGEELGWPLVLKARRNGYDGYGNATLRGPEDVEAALARLSGGTSAGGTGGLYVEGWVPFVQELAMMVARGRDGAIQAFPLVETVQRDHICHEVVVPADDVFERARAAAVGAVEAVDGIGVTGVELFRLVDGRVLVNELAPRPHNSGHYSIEACRTSQFANHLRGVLGRELGPTDLVTGGAAMVNLLGTRNGVAEPRGVDEAGRDAFVHIYGKKDVRVGRKMGHVTALADTPDDALDKARRAAARIAW
jgi:5-(carboxyamino)imidazole ribonucleotide synthase